MPTRRRTLDDISVEEMLAADQSGAFEDAGELARYLNCSAETSAELQAQRRQFRDLVDQITSRHQFRKIEDLLRPDVTNPWQLAADAVPRDPAPEARDITQAMRDFFAATLGLKDPPASPLGHRCDFGGLRQPHPRTTTG
jgi:hypothetical protein